MSAFLLCTAVDRLYKHAIQLEPNFPDAFNNLGNAYREVGAAWTYAGTVVCARVYLMPSGCVVSCSWATWTSP